MDMSESDNGSSSIVPQSYSCWEGPGIPDIIRPELPAGHSGPGLTDKMRVIYDPLHVVSEPFY